MNDEALRDLARRAGISVEWNDYAGQPQVVAPDSLRSILAALGLPADSRGDVAASRRVLAKRSTLTDLPPLVTATAGRPTRLDLGAAEPRPAKLMLEHGGSRELTLMPARGRLRIPAVAEIGYHRLEVGEREVVLAVAPAQCRTIDDVVPDARLWGVAAQVYALRSSHDGGIGDAIGIAELAEVAAARGADALCLSPMHALFTADPARFAPYSPSSRLFLNPLHAAPAMVFGREAVAQAMQDAGLGDAFARSEQEKLIDWPAAAAAKLDLLRALFDGFFSGPAATGVLGADFASFRADGADLLHQHATFEALHADRAPDHDWRHWTLDLREPDSAAVAAFAASRRDEVLFHEFLQWVADRSVAAAHGRAREAGMRIGLVGDLAVGMDPTGSHAWSKQRDILLGLAIGAPPDLFNPRGQDWGLTGFSPRALEDSGFSPFIATLRTALRNAGGLRIDHAMGLSRLWLVPEGADPANGAYLAYPLPDLLRLLALESARHNAIVVGEDLGTVPAGFRETLAQDGVHGMRVLWFEREGDNSFAPSDAWDAGALAMTTTHDLPTVAGWWHGADIAVRSECGRLGAGVSAEDASAERERDRAALWQRFTADGLVEGPAPPPEETRRVVDAALAFVVRTKSPLCLLPVEDLLGQEQQPNLPGTVNEHPNWRRRLPGPAEALVQDEATAARIAAVAAERPRT
ncbi:MAG TPA: 4-alpha-glucanotransferase [Acetobacteraceae bacterium]|jgi:4-alpha-glucanotransferase|nr:4-alpha-glucanotransferase [Acetobacteraceae bacterium]